MRDPFLVGDKIYLRRINKTDLQGNYFQWLNDQEVTRWMQHGIFPNSEKEMEAFYDSTSNSRSDIVFAIILKENDRHIGNIGIHRIHPVFRSAEIGMLIGEKDCWGKGIGSAAIGLLVGHAFLRLNLNRIYAGATEQNVGSIRAFEKVGFIQEGRARQAYYCEGAYVDCIQLGLLHSDWEQKRKNN